MRSIAHSFKNDVDSTEIKLRMFLLSADDVTKSKYKIVIIRIVLITSAFISLIAHWWFEFWKTLMAKAASMMYSFNDVVSLLIVKWLLLTK